MAWESYDTSGFASSGSSSSVPVPPGAAAGHIALLWSFTSGDLAQTPPDVNFAELPSPGFKAGRGRLRWFWKRLTSAESGAWVVSWTGSAEHIAWASLSSGRIETGDPFDFVAVDATPQDGKDQPDALTGTASAGADLIYGLDEWDGSTTLTATDPTTSTPYTARYNDIVGPHLFTRDAVAAGAVAAQAGIIGGDYWWTTHAALKPAAGGPGPIAGSVVIDLGALGTAAAGKRTVIGSSQLAAGPLDLAATGEAHGNVAASAAIDLGGLSISAAGRRSTDGATAIGLGGPTLAATGQRTVPGSATTALGGLDLAANAVGQHNETGAAALSLGGLQLAAEAAEPTHSLEPLIVTAIRGPALAYRVRGPAIVPAPRIAGPATSTRVAGGPAVDYEVRGPGA